MSCGTSTDLLEAIDTPVATILRVGTNLGFFGTMRLTENFFKICFPFFKMFFLRISERKTFLGVQRVASLIIIWSCATDERILNNCANDLWEFPALCDFF